MDNLNIIQATYTDVAKMIDEVTKEVMRQVLNREPVVEDAKNFQLITHINYPGITMIAYKGITLGKMYLTRTDYEDRHTISYIFEPGNSFD